MILYFNLQMLKQRILCCRKFIIIFGSSRPVLYDNFRAWQKYCILSLLSLGRFSEGLFDQCFFKKECLRSRVFTLTIRHFETGLVKSGKNPVVPGLSGRKLGLREDWNYSLLGSRVARDVMGRTKLENHALLISAVAVIAKKT